MLGLAARALCARCVSNWADVVDASDDEDRCSEPPKCFCGRAVVARVMTELNLLEPELFFLILARSVHKM